MAVELDIPDMVWCVDCGDEMECRAYKWTAPKEALISGRTIGGGTFTFPQIRCADCASARSPKPITL